MAERDEKIQGRRERGQQEGRRGLWGN